MPDRLFQRCIELENNEKFFKVEYVHSIHKIHFLLTDGAGVAQYSVRLRTGQPGNRGSIPGRGKGFFVLGVLFRRVKRSRGMTLTTHPHLVLRS
jgi:hypothetical protein